MANSFTVFPNVLPGNVTIGGNLTVGGDQLRIGAAAPFTRIGKDNTGRGWISANLGFDATTKDSAGVADFDMDLDTAGNTLAIQQHNTAGTLRNNALVTAIFTDYTTHTHTGTTTEDTIYSKLIPANTLGAGGGLRVRIQTKAGNNGATATTYRARLGGTQLANIGSDSTGFALMIEFQFRNKNAANSQDVSVVQINMGNGAVLGATNTVAIDTTVDQTLTITVQNGTSTDTQNFVMVDAEQMNSFGPV